MTDDHIALALLALVAAALLVAPAGVRRRWWAALAPTVWGASDCCRVRPGSTCDWCRRDPAGGVR